MRFNVKDGIMLTYMKSVLDNSQSNSLSTARLTPHIALAYLLLGAFGLMLAIGPGYASPIFPAAALSLVEAGLKNQNIEIHLEAPQDVVLTGLPNEYSQVILNLLSNAGEAVKGAGVAEGVIGIRLFERDGSGCVSISDNGGGIPGEVIDKIFEPYFSTKEMGTGIGLYMSKMIIERSMNGTIEARNINGGAEFVVSIPL